MSLMRKDVDLRRFVVKVMARRCGSRGEFARSPATQDACGLASPSCVLVPPVPLHKKGAGGMPRADLLAPLIFLRVCGAVRRNVFPLNG